MKLTIRIIMILLLITLFIVSHELTHYAIYEIYGCDTPSLSISWGSVSLSTDINSCYSDTVLISQSNAESIGYQVVPFFIIIIVIMLFKNKSRS